MPAIRQPWDSYASFYRQSGYARFAQEHRQSRGPGAISMIMVDQGPHAYHDPAVEETLIAIPLSTDRDYTWEWRLGGQTFARPSQRGETIIIPSGLASEWNVDASRRVLILAVPDAVLKTTLAAAGPRQAQQGFAEFAGAVVVDDFVEMAMMRLWQSLAKPDPFEAPLGGALLPALIWHLMSALSERPGAGDHIHMPLWRFRQVESFAAAHLHEAIRVEDLAQAADLSPRHFTRSFHAELGITPHKWLMEKRVEKAMRLLESSDQSLSAIAASCGFASQSHMSTQMRKLRAITPARFRDVSRRL